MPVKDDLENSHFSSAIGVGTRIFELAVWNNTMASIFQLDVLIEPKNINEYNTFSLAHADSTFQKGYDETILQMDNILELYHS